MAPKEKQAALDGGDDDDDDVLQAVVLADSFNHRFKPLTTHRPRCLLPICNAPLLEWTFESLVLAGIQEIFVVCRKHADLIIATIRNSKYSAPQSGVKITPIVTANETYAPGDALRDIYTHGVITSDFVLVSGDWISSVRIDQVIKIHKGRRKKNKDAIMTIVVKESGGEHRTRPRGDSGLFILDPSTSECLHYEPVFAHTQKTHTAIPRELLKAHPEIEIRNDLIDCGVDICAVEVPSLFQDNFDYLDVRRDFVHGILTSDLLNRNIFCHIVEDGYAARAKDLKSYHALSMDILSRWTFPLVPDGNYPGDLKYRNQQGNRYQAADESVTLSRTSKIGINTLLGHDVSIDQHATISNSTVGSGVVIGPSSTISGSHIFDNCQIGASCVIEDSIIGENVQLLEGTVLKRGCRLGEGVMVGPNVTLEEFSRVSTLPIRYEDESEGEMNESEPPESAKHLGEKGVGFLWPLQSSDEDEGDEVEAFDNQKFLRIGADLTELDDAIDSGSESDDSDLLPAAASPASSTTSLPLGGDNTRSEKEFLNECVQSLQRAFAEGHSVEDAAIELKTLRMASNVPLKQVREVVIRLLVDRVPFVAGAGQAAQVNKVVGRWGGLVRAVGGADGPETVSILQSVCSTNSTRLNLFSAMLMAFYNSDIVEEVDIQAWHSSAGSKGKPDSSEAVNSNMDECRQFGTRMLQRLAEQSSDDEESD